MAIFEDYVQTLQQPSHDILEHMYAVVRQVVPQITEKMSYGMPAFAYDGKAFLSIMANKTFLSLYPFCSLERLAIDVSAYECTKASIHFTPDKPIPDALLKDIVTQRLSFIRK